MKLIVNDGGKLIESAYLSENNYMISLVINLKDKCCSGFYNGSETFIVNSETDGQFSGITIADCNPSLIWFQNQEKDQIIFIGVYTTTMLTSHFVDKWKS